MTSLPEKTCALDRLITQPKLVEAVLAGRKTEQRRNGVYGWPGETFVLENKTFVITGLYRQRLGDMGDAGALAEGFPSLAVYQDIILRMHAGMDWDPESRVWVHAFAAQR